MTGTIEDSATVRDGRTQNGKKKNYRHKWDDEQLKILFEHYDVYADSRRLHVLKNTYWPAIKYPGMKLYHITSKVNSMKKTGLWEKLEAHFRGTKPFKSNGVAAPVMKLDKHSKCRYCDKADVCIILSKIKAIEQEMSILIKGEKVLELGASRCPSWAEKKDGQTSD